MWHIRNLLGNETKSPFELARRKAACKKKKKKETPWVGTRRKGGHVRFENLTRSKGERNISQQRSTSSTVDVCVEIVLRIVCEALILPGTSGESPASKWPNTSWWWLEVSAAASRFCARVTKPDEKSRIHLLGRGKGMTTVTLLTNPIWFLLMAMQS